MKRKAYRKSKPKIEKKPNTDFLMSLIENNNSGKNTSTKVKTSTSFSFISNESLYDIDVNEINQIQNILIKDFTSLGSININKFI